MIVSSRIPYLISCASRLARTRRTARPAFAAMLGLTAALLVACGGSSANLIPAQQAGPLERDFQKVAEVASSGDGECEPTEIAVRTAERAIESLPSNVEETLVSRLEEVTQNLRKHALKDCEKEAHTTTTSTTETATVTPPTGPITTTSEEEEREREEEQQREAEELREEQETRTVEAPSAQQLEEEEQLRIEEEEQALIAEEEQHRIEEEESVSSVEHSGGIGVPGGEEGEESEESETGGAGVQHYGVTGASRK
jgi:hypothetical protein